MHLRSVLLAVILIVAGCSRMNGVVEVTDSWAPSMPPTAQTGAIYLTVENGTGEDDRVVDVTTDRCGTTELHDTQIDENRVMRMRLAGPELLEVPSGGTLEMAPGGLHVMCLDPPTPFEDGETIGITVTMANGKTLSVQTPVENR
jgi:hypothetical protein